MGKDRISEFQTLCMKNGVMLTHNGKANSEDKDSYDIPSTSETEDLLEKEEWASVEEFLNRASDVNRNIEDLGSLVVDLRKVHDEVIQSPGAEPSLIQHLNDINDKFTSLSKQTNSLLTLIIQEFKESENLDEVQFRIKNNQIFALKKRLSIVLTKFNEEQVKYRDRCKAVMKTYYKCIDHDMTDNDIDEAIESGNLYSSKSLIFTNREEIIIMLKKAENRHQDIIKLEKSLSELHNMFLDISILVENQGDLLNNIEINVASTVEYIQKARRNVNQAREMSGRSRKFKIIICILITIGILLLLTLGVLTKGEDYYGVEIGKFKNNEYSISGTVYYANSSMLQIVGFNMDATNSQVKPRIFFSTEDASHPAMNVYVVQKSPGGLYSKRISSVLESGFRESRLIVEIPKSGKIDWSHVGIASEKNWSIIESRLMLIVFTIRAPLIISISLSPIITLRSIRVMGVMVLSSGSLHTTISSRGMNPLSTRTCHIRIWVAVILCMGIKTLCTRTMIVVILPHMTMLIVGMSPLGAGLWVAIILCMEITSLCIRTYYARILMIVVILPHVTMLIVRMNPLSTATCHIRM
ncbi:hypothetical protein FO519_008419 [Halicephalobus sp. NKZ332]|nr:hypothetical protein FO519_008419 [Halicephalobus sp. NKZ332]